MAEISIIGSIVGIVGVVFELSKKLYELSSTTTVAGEQINFVAKNVTNYALALELLADRLDGGDPVHSSRAVRVVEMLYDQSYDLFDRIEDMLPEQKNGRNDLNLIQKLTWNLKKKNAEFLATQIEYLKTTASLLATILFAGKRIKARRRSHVQRSSKSDRNDIAKDRTRIDVAVIEQVGACNKLTDLNSQTFDNRQVTQDTTRKKPEHADNNFQNAFTMQSNGSVETFLTLPVYQEGEIGNPRQVVLNQVENMSRDLLSQYTTIDSEGDKTEDGGPSRVQFQGIGLLTDGLSSVLDLSGHRDRHAGGMQDFQEGYASKSRVYDVGRAGSATDFAYSAKAKRRRRPVQSARSHVGESRADQNHASTNRTSMLEQNPGSESQSLASIGSRRGWSSNETLAAKARRREEPTSTRHRTTSSSSQRSRHLKSVELESSPLSGSREDAKDSSRLAGSRRRLNVTCSSDEEDILKPNKEVRKSMDATQTLSLNQATKDRYDSLKVELEEFLRQDPTQVVQEDAVKCIEYGAVCGMLLPESVPAFLGIRKIDEMLNIYQKVLKSQENWNPDFEAWVRQRADRIVRRSARTLNSRSKDSESESTSFISESETDQDDHNQPFRAR